MDLKGVRNGIEKMRVTVESDDPQLLRTLHCELKLKTPNLKPHPAQHLLHSPLELLRRERLGQMCVKSCSPASRDISFGAKTGESDR